MPQTEHIKLYILVVNSKITGVATETHVVYGMDQRFQRAFKPKQPSAGRTSEASEGGGTSGHPRP